MITSLNNAFHLDRRTVLWQPGTVVVTRLLLLACLVYSFGSLRIAILFDNSPTTISERSACYDKEPLRKILSDAGIKNLNCTALPSWNQITRLYGNEPVIIGLDTCAAYRQRVGNQGAVPRIAGMYNTGTNALAKLFELNWSNHTDQLAWTLEGSYFKWDVPFGKHVPLHKKDDITVPGGNPTPKELVLPVVLIKDPLWWMQSMCRNSYGAKWPHHEDHCPNLVANKVDKERFGILNSSIAVTTKYTFGTPRKKNVQKFQVHFASLVDVWNNYYREYLHSTSPRLMIRYEDMLYHAPTVFKAISDCVGIDIDQFHYITAKSKTHGAGETDFIKALAKYGNDPARVAPLTTDDRIFARQTLDQKLMNIFHYRYPED